MEAVLGERIRGLTYELLSHNLTKQQEIERIEQTAIAIEQQRQQQEHFFGAHPERGDKRRFSFSARVCLTRV